jgi:hypothetical protein
MRFDKGLLGVALAALTLAGPATAADKTRERAAELKAVLDCRPIQDTAQRLECFDKAAAALDAAEASGNVVVIDRKQALAARKEAFGFTLPSLAIFDRAATKGEVNAIESTLASANRDSSGHWILVLDTGARWRQIDNTEVYPEPHKGSKVKIHKATLGSFVMNIDGQPWIKVHREE